MRKKEHIHIGRHRIGRFRFLLLAMVSMFVLRPFLADYEGVGFLTDLFFSLILVSGVCAFSHQKKDLVAALILAFPALFLEVVSFFLQSESIVIMRRILIALFLACVLVIILSHIFRETEVTEDLITGAVCAYLLIGLFWTFIFYFLELARDGSFNLSKTARHDVGAFLYYSFVTLTTVGYGDVLPLTAPARSLAVLEAVTGQLYLATTIARLVGASASGSRSRERG
jgi:voltage-gated potassium channel